MDLGVKSLRTRPKPMSSIDGRGLRPFESKRARQHGLAETRKLKVLLPVDEGWKWVFREYLGSGPEAELSAELDNHRRDQRRENRETWTSFVSCLREADRLLDNLNQRSRLLVSAVLLSVGWHSHKGEWRRRRVYSNKKSK